MGKKKSDPAVCQVNVRFTEEDYARLKSVSDTLGIDVAQLVRSFVKRQLPHAEREADEVRRAEQKSGD